MQASRVTVGTTATLLASGDDWSGKSVVIRTPADIYVGGAGVTTSTGTLLAAGQVLGDVELKRLEKAYGVCASGTVEVQVLEIG